MQQPNFLQKLFGYVPQSTWDNLPHTLTSTALFYLVIPVTWDYIDSYLHRAAQKTNTNTNTSASIATGTVSPWIAGSSSEDKKVE